MSDIDKILLRPYHFQKPEPPMESEYLVDCCPSCGSDEIHIFISDNDYTCIACKSNFHRKKVDRRIDKDKFEKALQDYKAKFEEPEYEWQDFNHNIQAKGYLKTIDSEVYDGTITKVCAVISTENHVQTIPIKEITHWCDKEFHDKKVQVYNEHRVLFEGFEKMSTNEDDFILFARDGIRAFFHDNKCDYIRVFEEDGSLIKATKDTGWTVSQFKSITEIKRTPNV